MDLLFSSSSKLLALIHIFIGLAFQDAFKKSHTSSFSLRFDLGNPRVMLVIVRILVVLCTFSLQNSLNQDVASLKWLYTFLISSLLEIQICVLVIRLVQL